MKENLNREFLDLRKFDNPIDPVELIKTITSNPNTENDPFYIVDLEDICNKHINWITKLPRVEPHYAIKCNTDTMLLKLLAFLGAGFDCASKNEIQTVLDLGVSPHRIIFANPCKQSSNIKYAYKVGVDQMTFDNEAELHKIKENHPNAKVVLRIITNDADAVCKFSMKFGADMGTSLGLIDECMRLGLNLVGVSFHVGSGQMSPKAFTESIENARKLFDYARETHGCRMHLLDLGGGYPGSSDMMDLFDTVSMEINKSLNKHFPLDYFNESNGYSDEHRLRVIAEPGRYYAASAFTLCVNVIAKRAMNQSDMQQKQDREALLNGRCQINDSDLIDTTKSHMYYINDGVYASFNCLFYDHAECFPLLIKDHSEETALYKSSIWGPTCDGLDLVVKECHLPQLDVGEFLVFKNMGAYTISGAVAFNGIPLARCIYAASTSWDTIKDAFTDQFDEQCVSPFVGSLLKESVGMNNNHSISNNNTCAAANLAFSRALSSLHYQQQQQITNNSSVFDHHHLLPQQQQQLSADDLACLIDDANICCNLDVVDLSEKLGDENVIPPLDKSVDCAITC